MYISYCIIISPGSGFVEILKSVQNVMFDWHRTVTLRIFPWMRSQYWELLLYRFRPWTLNSKKEERTIS